MRVYEVDVLTAGEPAQEADRVPPYRDRVLLEHQIDALREHVREHLDQIRLVDAMRNDALDLEVVRDVQREVDEGPRGQLLTQPAGKPRACSLLGEVRHEA